MQLVESTVSMLDSWKEELSKKSTKNLRKDKKKDTDKKKRKAKALTVSAMHLFPRCDDMFGFQSFLPDLPCTLELGL